MDSKKLSKLQHQLDALLAKGGVKSREIQGLAKKLGRKKQGKRGKEPTWTNEIFSHLRPVSIPDHGNRDLNRFTVKGILEQLQEDIDCYYHEHG